MIYDTKVIFYSDTKKYVPGRGYVAGDGGTAVIERWANVTNTDIQTQQAVFGDVSIESYVIRLLHPISSDFKISHVEIGGSGKKFKIGQIRHTLKGDAYIVGEAKGGAI
ncbi:MAG: hypothetical protein MJZ72_09965 [Bacteroidales bacterium]|nr:hypothetical protein [Bacteroidales bacterium]